MSPFLIPRLILAVVAVIVLAAFYGFISQYFIPTPLMVDLGLVAGAAFALLAAWYGFTGTFRPSARGGWLGNNRFARAIAMALLAFWGGFSAVVAGLPALYTKAAGKPAERHTVVAGWHSRGRHNCAGPDIPDTNSFITRLCWSQRLPDGTKLELKGEESPLGFEVEDFGPRN